MINDIKNFLFMILAKVQYLFLQEEGVVVPSSNLLGYKSVTLLSFVLARGRTPEESRYYEPNAPHVLYSALDLIACINEFIEAVNKNEFLPFENARKVVMRKIQEKDNSYLDVYGTDLSIEKSVIHTDPALRSFDSDKEALPDIITVSIYGPHETIQCFNNKMFSPRFQGKTLTRYFRPTKLIAIDYIINE